MRKMSCEFELNEFVIVLEKRFLGSLFDGCETMGTLVVFVIVV